MSQSERENKNTEFPKMKRIRKFAKRIVSRKNITAVSMIFVVGAVAFSLALASFVFSYWRGWQIGKDSKKERNSAYMQELRKFSGITTNLEAVPDITANWKQYENDKYGFAIKYPQNWENPEDISPTADNKYISRISFVSSAGGQDRKGFDVYVYPISRFPGPENTDNLVRKNDGNISGNCARFGAITLGGEGYPAKEIDVKGGDPCFEETFFYSLAKGNYLYNIVPLETGYNISNYDDKVTLIKTDPQFYDIISTLSFAEKTEIGNIPRKIVQRAVSPPKVRFVGGGGKCPEKNDHPRYSKTKGKHMDEDCCPDPDEWPNPRCSYSGGGMGILRAKPKK